MRGRAAFLLLLLAAPLGAAAGEPALRVRVEAPAVAPQDGAPFLVAVEVEGPPGAAVELLARWGPPGKAASRTWDGAAWNRSDRYVLAAQLDAEGRWRGDAALQANPTSARYADLLAGPGEVAVRARPAGGGAPAEARAATAAAALDVVPVAAAREAAAWVGGAPALRAPAGVPGTWPALAGHAWLARPGGSDAASADGGAPRPWPAPPEARLVEVVPRGDAESVVVGGEGGPLCVAVAARARCLAAPAGARVALAADAAAYARRAGEEAAAELGFALPDGGGEARLAWGSRALDALAWPAGARPDEAVRADGSSSRVARTRWAPAPFEAAEARLLVAPQDTFPALAALLASARERVVVETYTLASAEVAALLAEAARRGARVRVLVDGAPVGGASPEQEGALAALAAAGVEVLAARGPTYGAFHAKFVAVDGRAALVATENLGPGGFPPSGQGPNRGFALLVESADLARALEDLFEADARSPDAAPWTGEAAPLPPAPWAPRAVGGVALGPLRGRLLVGPEHAAAEVAARVAAAERSVHAAALRLDPAWTPNPFVEAYLAAAEGGAAVRVLLAAPPEGRDNAAAAAALAERGAGLDLVAAVERSPEVRLLHAKAWAVDGRWALVGSLNGNRASAEENREVVVEVESAAAAAALAAVVESDGRDEAPAPAAGAALAAAALALAARRRQTSGTPASAFSASFLARLARSLES